jgi:hypothetical protein
MLARSQFLTGRPARRERFADALRKFAGRPERQSFLSSSESDAAVWKSRSLTHHVAGRQGLPSDNAIATPIGSATAGWRIA